MGWNGRAEWLLSPERTVISGITVEPDCVIYTRSASVIAERERQRQAISSTRAFRLGGWTTTTYYTDEKVELTFVERPTVSF